MIFMSLLDLIQQPKSICVELEIPKIGSPTLNISRASSLTKHQGEFTYNLLKWLCLCFGPPYGISRGVSTFNLFFNMHFKILNKF